MGTQQEESRSYFTTLQDEDAEFDGDRSLTEVGSQFQSDVIMQEVRWRIGVLKEISSQPELAEVSDGLRIDRFRYRSPGSFENPQSPRRTTDAAADTPPSVPATDNPPFPFLLVCD